MRDANAIKGLYLLADKGHDQLSQLDSADLLVAQGVLGHVTSKKSSPLIVALRKERLRTMLSLSLRRPTTC